MNFSDIMQKLSRSILATVLVIASFSSLAMTTNSSDSILDSISAMFGRHHAPVGNATLTLLADGALAINPQSDGLSGLSISLDDVRTGLNSNVNIHTEAVQLTVGESFSSKVKDVNGADLVSVRYEQVSPNTSNIFVRASKTTDVHVVNLATFHDGIETASSSVSLNGETFVGTVKSDGSWIKSWHLTCDYFGCFWATDDDGEGGSLTFNDNPEESVPFTYLTFGFGENEILRQASSVQLVTSAPFTIIEENTQALNLIY